MYVISQEKTDLVLLKFFSNTICSRKVRWKKF